jgi:hypothetical protein
MRHIMERVKQKFQNVNFKWIGWGVELKHGISR